MARVDHHQYEGYGQIYWFSTDINGAPLEVTDERGDLRWSGHYGSFGEVNYQTEGFWRQVKSATLSHQSLRYAGQYSDRETGLHYNLFRYYDPQTGRFTVQDPIGLKGGWNLYQYAPNPQDWIDPLGLTGKPLNSPTVKNWFNKGGSIWQEIDGRTWVYQDWEGNVVRYPDGYPDFKPYAIQSVDVPDLKGNHDKQYGDFAKADARASNGGANYDVNTWHHHENGVTMMEVPKDIHDRFRHRGGVSAIKRKLNC